ncbi:MAG TPA: hypothetical protein VM345_17040 [Acidimicrobiales bacterium]|nr:hypothetical protein [Acidimicrobiales bacterium]
MRSTRIATIELTAWIALLGATVVALPMLGATVTAPPVFDGIDALQRWASVVDPAAAVAGVLRLGVHAMAVYLLVTTLASIVAHRLAARRGRPATTLDRFVAPPLRRLVRVACGVTLTVGVASLTRPAPAASPPATVAPLPSTSTTLPLPPPLPVEGSTAGSADTDGISGSDDTTGVDDGAEPAAEEWLVEPGDHLWAIAEATLADRWGREPTDREVDPYWRHLVEANRDRLVVANDPDLLIPGHHVVVPPVPAPPVANA